MANKLSRSGLALGLATALGASTLIGAAPAAAAETMTLKLKDQTSNGVLATTTENDFDLVLDFEGSNTNLQYLKYDFTVETDGDYGATVSAETDTVGWNSIDDVATETVETTTITLPNLAGDADRSITSSKAAPASASGLVDNNVTYTRNIYQAGILVCSQEYQDTSATTEPTGFTFHYERNFDSGNGAVVGADPATDTVPLPYVFSDGWEQDSISSNAEEWASIATIASGCSLDDGTAGTPGSDNGANDGTDGTNGTDGLTYVLEYSSTSGEFSGTVEDGRISNFVSDVDLLVTTLGTGSTYVDVTVQAYLDTDGTVGMTGTETRSQAMTVRFWNPESLTPVLTLADSGDVWFNAAGDTVNVVTETYLSQELNEKYTTVLTEVQNNWTVINDLNYEYSRDGYINTVGAINLAAGAYTSALSAFAFDTSAPLDYSGKHLYQAATISGEQEDINRVSVVDGNLTQTDTFFPGGQQTVSKIVSGPLMVSFLQRTAKDAVALPVESDLVIASTSAAAESDSLAHESATEVQYVITVLDEDVASWSEFGTTLGAAKGIPSVDVVVNGIYTGNTEMGAISINGTSVLDDTSDATKAAGAFEMEATTNSSGQLTLTIAIASPSADLTIALATIEVQGTIFDLDDVDSNTANIDFQASTWALVNELNAEDSSVRHVQVGDSTSVRYDVRDQFMRAPANGAARVLFEYDASTVGNNTSGESRDFSGSIGDTVNVTNGASTVVVPDVNPAADEGSVTIAAKLYVQTTFGGWPSTAIATESMTIDYVENAAVAEIAQVEGVASTDVSYFDFLDINAELSRTSAAQEETISESASITSSETDITGYIRTAEGLPLRGQKVTISGSGLLFSDDLSPEFFGVGSLTLFTDSSGMYKFNVAGQVVGAKSLTITSGGKSATADFCVGSWGVDEDGNDVCDAPTNLRAHNVAITSAFAAKTGTADTLTALVTDRYGNTMKSGEAVTFTVVSGSGYIQEAVGTTTTDEDGVATATLIVLGGEIGFNSTVRAAITQDDFAAAGNSAAAQRSAGDTNLDKTTAWTKLQTDGTAKMYAKNIVGAGKVQFFHNGNEIAWVRAADALNPKLRAANGAFYLVRTVELVDGKNVLEVYIDGERVRRTAYSK